MSYIHKALKKAQREKDAHYQGYDSLLSRDNKKNIFSGKAIIVFTLLVVIGCVTFAFYSWKNHSWVNHGDDRSADKSRKITQKPEDSTARIKQSSEPTVKRPSQKSLSKEADGSVKPVAGSTSKEANAKQIYNSAVVLHKNGRLSDAKRLYQDALKSDPEFVDALNNLGVIYLHEKQFKKARANFETAIRVKPENVDSHYNIACVYSLRGEIELGIIHLRKACALNKEAKIWAIEDADLENLRTSPEFEKTVKME